MNILDCVAYTELSPSGLVWTKCVAKHVKVGDPSGHVNTLGYWRIGWKYNTYLVHRVIWELHNGPIPDGLDIDHKDRNPSNNRIDNLRLANKSQNNHNKAKQKNNTSGYKGVCWHKCKNRWMARIKLHGVHYTLGYFKSPEDAHKAYCAKSEQLHKEFSCA